jgi:pilus assembly protein CpaC
MRAQAHIDQPIRRLVGTIILIVAVFGPARVYAQVAAASRAVTPVAALETASPVEPAADAVRLLVGRSTIVDVGKPIARVSLTSADVADAHVTSPNQLLINGKAPGTISMFVWDRGGAIRRYDVFVQRDLARLTSQLKELFPKESIDVRANGKSAVLSGTVSSKDVADKMASLAGSFVESKEELVSLLQVGEAGRSNQVLLRVRFAEVSRSAMTELGMGLFTSPTGINNTIGRVTTGQFPAPGFDELKSTKEGFDFGDPVTSASGKFTFSDFLNLFLYNQKFDLGVMIKALQTKGLFQSLAEPNLVAESGKEASFLAGGEFPIPVAQTGSGGTSISVMFKEFGVRLNFTPTVNGDRIHLKVRPEVSTLDFNNAVVLNGFRIPALTTRRTETEIELNNHQTFAIAGLINNNMISSVQKVPGLGDIPILGYLFRSKAAQKNLTELVVMITPEILPNNSPGVTSELPRQMEPYIPPLTDRQTVPSPPAAFPSAPATRTQSVAPVTQPVAAATDRKPSAAAAAATLKQQSPATRSVVRTPESVPAASAAPASASPAPETAAAESPSRPASAAERKAAERAAKDQQERDELEARAMAAESERRAKQAEVDRRKQKEENERLARVNRAQAQRDAELAKEAAEQARKQAEIDKKHQKEIADAQNRLRAAQLRYQAELGKQ